MNEIRNQNWAGLWDHLEDLRITLIQSFYVIGTSFIILLFFYEPILSFLTKYSSPFITHGLITKKIEKQTIFNPTKEIQRIEIPNHILVLANPPISKQKNYSRFYELESGQSLTFEKEIPNSLLILGPLDGLTLTCKICFWLSVGLSAPFWIWIWAQFILPGLRTHEQTLFFSFISLSLLCIGIGVSIAYFITLPIANESLAAFNSKIGINAWTFTEYFNFILLICLGHIITAEMGLFLILLVHFRFLKPESLTLKRRYMIVGIFTLSAIATPPDIFSQVLLAFPLMILYEIAILYAKFRHRRAFTLLSHE